MPKSGRNEKLGVLEEVGVVKEFDDEPGAQRTEPPKTVSHGDLSLTEAPGCSG